MLDLHLSTVHRYISTLTAVGLLEREPVTRRYRLAW
ncbi:MAG TPA: helix-turn-helix domain-containing protein [Solirubrobacteraceae bacterium]